MTNNAEIEMALVLLANRVSNLESKIGTSLTDTITQPPVITDLVLNLRDLFPRISGLDEAIELSKVLRDDDKGCDEAADEGNIDINKAREAERLINIIPLDRQLLVENNCIVLISFKPLHYSEMSQCAGLSTIESLENANILRLGKYPELTSSEMYLINDKERLSTLVKQNKDQEAKAVKIGSNVDEFMSVYTSLLERIGAVLDGLKTS